MELCFVVCTKILALTIINEKVAKIQKLKKIQALNSIKKFLFEYSCFFCKIQCENVGSIKCEKCPYSEFF